MKINFNFNFSISIDFKLCNFQLYWFFTLFILHFLIFNFLDFHSIFNFFFSPNQPSFQILFKRNLRRFCSTTGTTSASRKRWPSSAWASRRAAFCCATARGRGVCASRECQRRLGRATPVGGIRGTVLCNRVGVVFRPNVNFLALVMLVPSVVFRMFWLRKSMGSGVWKVHQPPGLPFPIYCIRKGDF